MQINIADGYFVTIELGLEDSVIKVYGKIEKILKKTQSERGKLGRL